MQLNFEIYKHTKFYKKLNQLKEPFLNDLKKCFLGSKCIPKNITLMTQNQNLQYLYLIYDGSIAFEMTTLGGKTYQLGNVKCDHTIIGEMEFYSNTLIQSTVVASEKINVEVISIALLEQLLEEKPEYHLIFTTSLSYDYLDSLDVMYQRILHPISYNIAIDLLKTEKKLTSFNSSIKEAERFGTSDRVYRRAVKGLIELNLITKEKNKLVIVDRKKLEEYIESMQIG